MTEPVRPQRSTLLRAGAFSLVLIVASIVFAFCCFCLLPIGVLYAVYQPRYEHRCEGRMTEDLRFRIELKKEPSAYKYTISTKYRDQSWNKRWGDFIDPPGYDADDDLDLIESDYQRICNALDYEVDGDKITVFGLYGDYISNNGGKTFKKNYTPPSQ